MPDAAGTVRLQPLVRARVAALGEQGRAWADALPCVLADLAGRWDLQLGRQLPGGSASHLTAVLRADGSEAVLKVALPERGPAGHAHRRAADLAATLRAADGRGQVLLLEADPALGALLLERLGPSLDHVGLAPGRRLEALAATLLLAWRPPDRPATDRAGVLAAQVRARAARLPDAVRPEVVERALAYADALAAPDPADLVLAHGDPHPGNLLRVRRPRPGAETGWCLVDPEPCVTERAYDLGVAVRDLSSTLLALGPEQARERLWSWCRTVAAPSGTDPARVWAWAYLERVSTGLYVTSFGAPRVGEPFLRSAEHLLEGQELLGPPSVLPDVGTSRLRS